MKIVPLYVWALQPCCTAMLQGDCGHRRFVNQNYSTFSNFSHSYIMFPLLTRRKLNLELKRYRPVVLMMPG